MRPLLAVPTAFAVLLLTACVGGSVNDPQNDAFAYCEKEVAATFDDPDAVEFSQWTGGGVPDDQRYEFESTVTADGGTFDLTCTVTGEYGSFLLESYNLTPTG
jgi:hypothetical protein